MKYVILAAVFFLAVVGIGLIQNQFKNSQPTQRQSPTDTINVLQVIQNYYERVPIPPGISVQVLPEMIYPLMRLENAEFNDAGRRALYDLYSQYYFVHDRCGERVEFLEKSKIANDKLLSNARQHVLSGYSVALINLPSRGDGRPELPGRQLIPGESPQKSYVLINRGTGKPANFPDARWDHRFSGKQILEITKLNTLSGDSGEHVAWIIRVVAATLSFKDGRRLPVIYSVVVNDTGESLPSYMLHDPYGFTQEAERAVFHNGHRLNDDGTPMQQGTFLQLGSVASIKDVNYD